MSFFKYFDPFYPYDVFVKFLEAKGIKSKILFFIIFVVYALVLAYILLTVVSAIMGVPEAMKIVVSGSMIPNLDIGDVVILYNPAVINTTYVDLNENIFGKPLKEFAKINYTLDSFGPHTQSIIISEETFVLNKSGDIIVYYSPTQKKEIIHRVVLGIRANDGVFYLTKGDNEKTNFVLDADCGFELMNKKTMCIYPVALPQSEVISKQIFTIPYLGYIKLLPMYLVGWQPS